MGAVVLVDARAESVMGRMGDKDEDEGGAVDGRMGCASSSSRGRLGDVVVRGGLSKSPCLMSSMLREGDNETEEQELVVAWRAFVGARRRRRKRRRKASCDGAWGSCMS